MGTQGRFSFVIVLCLAILTSGCGVLPTASPTTGEECPVAADDRALNLYAIDMEEWVGEVYQHSLAPDIPNQSDLTAQGRNLRQARNAAFKIFGWQVRRWSSFVDFKLVNTNDIVRITVTYLSPQLIETIMLNEAIQGEIPPKDSLDVFQGKLKNKLSHVGARSEVLFLMTISVARNTPDLNGALPIIIKIPFQNLILINSDGRSVRPKRFDQSLNHAIYLNDNKPFSSIFGYQMTVKTGETCSKLLDPNMNTTITVYLDNLAINDQTFSGQTWTIRYESLLGEDGLGSSLPFDDVYPIPSHWAPTLVAPSPQISMLSTPVAPLSQTTVPSTMDNYWDSYWQLMACYIWEQVTYANSP